MGARGRFTTSQFHPCVVKSSAFCTSPSTYGCQEHHPVWELECPGLLTKGKLQWHSAKLWGLGECHIFDSSWATCRQLSIKGPLQRVVMALLIWLLSQEITWGSRMVCEHWFGFYTASWCWRRRYSWSPPLLALPLGQDPPDFFREDHSSSNSPPPSSAQGKVQLSSSVLSQCYSWGLNSIAFPFGVPVIHLFSHNKT